MRPDGMQAENLTLDPANDRDPAYDPRGRRIAFVSDRADGALRLHVMTSEGEDVRRSLAIDHLKSARFSVEEVAYRLGYSDAANFRRAFKRWESVPPSTYRARLRQAEGERV